MNEEEDLGFSFTPSRKSSEEDGFSFTPSSEFKKKNPYLEKPKDYGKTILKGTAEGVSRFGQMLSGTHPEDMTPEEQAARLDELLPLEGEEDFGQRAIRRGLRMAPSALSFPGSALEALPRSLVAGFFGEGAKDLGLPEWAQTAAEITAFMGPDITKKLIEKGENGELIKAAKELGISDEALTPLLKSDFQKKWLSKLVPRRGRVGGALEKSRGELSGAYSSIAKSEEALSQLSPEAQKDLMNSFGDKLFKMPSEVRNKIKEDFRDLVSQPITGESLINFYADVNHNLGENTKQLSLLKEPIRDALKSISPQLGKDFELVNNLYTKYHKIAGALKPNLKTDIIEASEAIGMMLGMYNGDFTMLQKVAGERVVRELGVEFLKNPRFAQLGTKTIEAMNNNKPAIVMKLVDELARQVRKISPEIADKLEEMTGFEISQFLNRSNKEEKAETK